MRVRMKTMARGPDFNANPDDVVEVSAERAADLINGGYAQAVKGEPETAEERGAEEDADAPRPKRRRRSRS